MESNEFINKTQIGNFTYINKDNLKNFLDINNAMVKWTGEKFEPKELSLQRLNTKTMQSENEMFYKRVITTKLATTTELPLQVEPKFISNFSNSESPVFYEALQKSINTTNKNQNHFMVESSQELQLIFNNVTTEMQNEKLANDALIKETHHTLIAKLEEKTGQLTAEINNVRSASNENRGIIDNHFNHHESRINQLWGEIDGIKNILLDIKKDLTYSCWMAHKCHPDKLKTVTWGD